MAPSSDFDACEALLRRTWEEVAPRHPGEAAKHFVSTHWNRYAHVLAALPALEPAAPVLEVGASIVASALKRRGADVHVAYHELEGEWKKRFAAENIQGSPVELLRDPLPYAPNTFALILFDEVMEHFPLAPDFFLRQLFRLLRPAAPGRPAGQLILSVPNFATWEHRMALLRGRNPQDVMDNRYVYYAHHREPVMQECLELVARCGGRVLESRWTDYARPVPRARQAWNLLRYLRHLEFHKIAHVLFPPMRSYLFIRAERAANVGEIPAQIPPMAESKEFAPRGA